LVEGGTESIWQAFIGDCLVKGVRRETDLMRTKAKRGSRGGKEGRKKKTGRGGGGKQTCVTG